MIRVHKKQEGNAVLVLVVVIAIAAVLGGLVLYKMRSSRTSMTSIENQLPPSTGQQASSGPSGVTSPTDTSNTALDKDTANINAQINALDSNQTNVDQSLNVTPEGLQ